MKKYIVYCPDTKSVITPEPLDYEEAKELANFLSIMTLVIPVEDEKDYTRIHKTEKLISSHPVTRSGRIRCIECGLPIPDMPKDASYEELLCNSCYKMHEDYYFEDEKTNGT